MSDDEGLVTLTIDGAVSPLDSSIKHFREEYEAHVRERGCPLKGERPILEAATARTGGTTGATAQILPEGLEIELGEVLG